MAKVHMNKILITGGAGYIGSHVLKMLGEQGHDITVIDDLSTGREASILYGKFLKFDLGDKEKLEEVIKNGNFDICYHFAGSIIVPESVSDPIKYYENNTVKTFNLLKLCKTYKINKFIFSSTAAVYGDTEGGLCSETTPIKPLNPYGKTKYMTEWMLEDFANAYPAFKYVIFRYFNVAGANIDGKIGQCSPNATHLIKIASEAAVGKRPGMEIYGEDYDTEDGTCIRDYIHIDDLAQAHVDAMSYLETENKSQVFNCGYGKGFSVKEVIATVKKVSGKDFNVKVSGRRPGDSAKLMSKVEKIKNVLKWKPKYNDIELIVKTALDWEAKLK